MDKIGRNDPCPCGSGKKYKNCCMSDYGISSASNDTDPLDMEIHQAGMKSLEHGEEALLEAIERQKKLLSRLDLKPRQRITVQVNLAQSYQRRGMHKTAIEVLDSINGLGQDSQDRIMELYVKSLRGVSYCALGRHKESCEFFDEALRGLDQPDVDPRFRALISIEAGKAFRANGDNNRAKECWKQAVEILEGKKDDFENYLHAKANLGILLLDDPDEAIQEEAVKMLQETSEQKAGIGDLEGIANNYCILGLYYWRKKRYERAIAFTRKDLYFSRKIGNLRGTASTLINLAGIYAELKQLTPARKSLKEVKEIAEGMNDLYLMSIAKSNLNRIEEIGREAGQKKEKIGPSANCGCGSGKVYKNCCGRADFEPIDIPMEFGGISEDLDQIMKEVQDAGGEPSRLDFIFRHTSQSKERLAWSRIHIHDGWLEMDELPDVANYHLISAQVLAVEAQSVSDSYTKPLACVILSVCALEAFINQVAFFLHEIQSFAESKLHSVPPEIAGDVMEFERRTELVAKWEIISKALCRSYWPPPEPLYTDFRNLIYIRNELVHFKSADYEQVVPPPKTPNDIFKRVPKSVETREVPHAWPIRLLTPSFASWCVKVTESMLEYFKQSYIQCRLDSTNRK